MKSASDFDIVPEILIFTDGNSLFTASIEVSATNALIESITTRNAKRNVNIAKFARLTTIVGVFSSHRAGIIHTQPNSLAFRKAQSRLRKSAQDDKWSFCLTAGTLCPTNQERQ